jgi:hypothetical protein
MQIVRMSSIYKILLKHHYNILYPSHSITKLIIFSDPVGVNAWLITLDINKGLIIFTDHVGINRGFITFSDHVTINRGLVIFTDRVGINRGLITTTVLKENIIFTDHVNIKEDLLFLVTT